MKQMQVVGSGGKKSGGGFSEADDTLSSTSIARFVDLISEGPILGLVNGQSSIYLDGVPLRDLQGTPNFPSFVYDHREGQAVQDPMAGFTGTLQDVAVGLTITTAGGPLVRPVPDSNADSVRITLGVNGLTKTDTSGNISAASVDYKISARLEGGTWVQFVYTSFSGKTRSHYQRSHEIPLSALGVGPYEVKVERITADTNTSLINDTISWDNYTIIHFDKLAYPYSALIGVQVDARYFTQVPTRAYHIKGRIVRVPTNYYPEKAYAEQYATTGSGTTNGAWDGTFKLAWTNNPVWCYYDMLTNTRYGAGKRIDAAALSRIKADLYAIAKYCDEPVYTGVTGGVQIINSNSVLDATGGMTAAVPVTSGPMEPRFSLNVVINTADDAQKVLGDLASAFRGMAYWSSASVMVTQDSPKSPVMQFTNANVQDGTFNYAGSSRANRHTTVMVGWNDPSDNFRQKFEYVEDRAGILRYGIRNTDIVAFGCTSRSQARRAGLWLLYTERIESDAITFGAGLDAAYLKPGDVVRIVDNDMIGVRFGGRISTATSTTVKVDQMVTLAAGSYTLSIVYPDGTMADRLFTLADAGDYDTFTVPSAFDQVPQALAVWSLASNAVSPQIARVIGIKESDAKGWFEITCLENVQSKYAAIETGAQLVIPSYSTLDASRVASLSSLTAHEVAYKPTRQSATISRVDLSWDVLADPLLRGYQVRMQASDGSVRIFDETKDPSLTITDIPPGSYTVYAKAVNQVGVGGVEVSVALTVTGIDRTPPSDVTAFSYAQDAVDGLSLTWADVVDYIDVYEIRRGATWASGTVVWSAMANRAVIGPVAAGTSTYWIAAVDTAGNYSANPAPLSVTTAVPSAPGVSATVAGTDLTLVWNPPAAPFGISHYVVTWGADFATGTVVAANLAATSLTVTVDFGGSRAYFVAAVDAAGNVGSAGRADVAITVPGDVQGRRADVVDNNALLYWTAPLTGTLPVNRYEVRKGSTWDAGTVVGSNGNSTFAGLFEQQSGTYTYWISAVDSAGNYGSASSIVATIAQPPDYTLRVNIDSTFNGTLASMVPAPLGGGILGPVNTTDTFSTHFSGHSWATPQDQIDSGNPLYINPAAATGAYTELIDYGTALTSSTISVTPAVTLLQGTVSYSVQIQVKLNVGDAWTSAPAGATSYLAANFRYVNVIVTFTSATGGNLIQMAALNIKLSSKRINDGGSGVISNATTGVLVNFTRTFVSADTPRVQADGLTPLLPVVDYASGPNPTSFTVYLYNQAGTKVTGSFSWSASGFS